MKQNTNSEDKSYIYITKDSAYNDTCLTAFDTILYKGTPVIFETKHGLDLGHILDFARTEENPYKKGCTCIRGAALFDSPCSCGYEHGKKEEVNKSVVGENVSYIDHVATVEEVVKYNDNKAKEDEALKVCSTIVKRYKLDMKLISCHFLVCENKVIFFFIADDRVDFRDLVKELGQVFKMRIELRQVGAREQAKFLGGLSICGYDYCCHGNNNSKNPVTVKMAKEQKLALNSSKSTGPCNKLLCCIDNEGKAKNNIPNVGMKIKIAKDLWTINQADAKLVNLEASGDRSLSIPTSHLYLDVKNKRWKIDREFISLYEEVNEEGNS